MKRAFVINILLLLALNLFVKPLYIFGIDVQIQNTIGPEQYGLFFSIFNYTLLFQFILEYGITNFVKREISIEPGRIHTYFSGLLILKAGFAMMYFGVVLGFAWLFQYSDNEIRLIIQVAGIQFFITLVAFLRGLIIGQGWYKTDSIFSVLDKVIMILLLGWRLYWPGMQPPDLAYFVETYLFSVVITAIIVFIFMLFRLHLKWVKPDLSLLKTLIIRLTPYTLITFLMGVYGRLDSVLLHALLPDGDYQAGIYAAGFRMLDTYLMLAILFSNLLLPMLSAQQANKDAIRDLLKFVIGIVMTTTIIAGVGGWVFRQEITNVLYHQSDEKWYDTVGLLFLTMIPVGLSTLYGAAIMSTGRLHRQNILFLSGIVLSLTFNILFIPWWQSLGSAISAFSVNLVIAAAQVIIFVKESDMGEDRGFYRRMILFFILSFVLFYIATLLAKSFLIAGLIAVIVLLWISKLLGLMRIDMEMAKKLFSGKGRNG